MNNIFCTLFDSNYLDKGIALINSLKKSCIKFKIYVFLFDELSKKILDDISFEEVITISVFDLEKTYPFLKKLKKERSKAEFCWTCTPLTIEYVMDCFFEKICTYIDADMFFYSDPAPIIEEIKANSCSVAIVEHRFPKKKEKKMISKHGKYCVEFNTFLNTQDGRKCLSFWKDSCIKECKFSKKAKDSLGDQKYLQSFESMFAGVYVIKNIGVGIAPWNFDNYYYKESNKKLVIADTTKCWSDIYFCHFQNIRYLPFNLVNIKSNTSIKFVKRNLYIPYLREIEVIRLQLLNKYKLSFSIKKSYYKNPIKRFIQNYILPFKIKRFSDIISLKKIRKM